MPTRTPFTAVALAKYNAVDHAKMPKGWIGVARTDVDQDGITADEDLDSMSVSVDLAADRMYEVTFSVPVATATGGDRLVISLHQSATKIGGAELDAETANVPYTASGFKILDGPAAGTVTFKLSAGLGGGATGPMKTDHNSDIESVLVIKDIGPAS